MTKTTVTPREKLRQWVAKNDLDAMSLEEMIQGLLRCGLVFQLGGLTTRMRFVVLLDGVFVTNTRSPSTAVRRAIRQAVKE